MTEYKLGDYVRIHDHDGAEITVKITDSGIPNRQGDFTFKAGARMFKNSEILGLGEVPVTRTNEVESKYEIGDQVITALGGRAVVVLIDHKSSAKAFQDKLAATRNKDRRNQKVRMVTK